MPDMDTKTRSVSDAPPAKKPVSKNSADAKFAAKAAATGGRTAVGAAGRDAAQRASTGGALKPSNVLPRRPSDLGKGSSFGSRAKKTGASSSPKVRLPRGKSSRLLMLEFLICFTVLGAGTIVAPQGSKDGVPRLMTRGTGLALLFFILSLTASAGEKPGKAAAGLGALVTAAYLFTSSDATNVAKWMGKFFSRDGLGLAAAGADAGAAAGVSDSDSGGGGPAGTVGAVIGETAGAVGGTLAAGAGAATGASAGQSSHGGKNLESLS